MNKPLPKHISEEDLLAACHEQSRQAQRMLYERYAGKMLAVCKRYLGNSPEAEDVLLEGFMKVFSKMNDFQSHGSFEGWVRRIMVNECLMKLRKNQMIQLPIEEQYQLSAPEDALGFLGVEELEQLIDELPIGFKTVFNLYAIEGYSHSEIAEMLQISEGTSKSQLSRARVQLQRKLIMSQHEQ